MYNQREGLLGFALVRYDHTLHTSNMLGFT